MVAVPVQNFLLAIVRKEGKNYSNSCVEIQDQITVKSSLCLSYMPWRRMKE